MMLDQTVEPKNASGNSRVNPKRLFFQRMVFNWQFQWQAWSTVIDWVIALYIIVPFGAAAVWWYVKLWSSPPDWFTLIPEGALGLLVFILAWTGNLRWFVVEGDMLFLLQRTRWIQTLRKLGMSYSLITNGLASLMLTILIAPLVWNQYEWSFDEWLGFGLLNFVLRTSLSAAVQFGVQLSLFRKIGFYAGLVLLTLITVSALMWCFLHDSLIFYAGLLFLFGIMVVLLRSRLRSKGNFMYEVELERKARRRVAEIVVSDYVKKKRRLFQLKHPIVFSKSMRIFRKRRTLPYVLAETALKTFLRNFPKVRQYVQITMMGMLAIALSPFAVRWIVWVCLGALIAYWARWHWREHLHANYLSLLRIEEKHKIAAAEIFAGLAMLPCWALLSLEVALLGLPSFYGLLALPLGAFISYVTAKIQGLFPA